MAFRFPLQVGAIATLVALHCVAIAEAQGRIGSRMQRLMGQPDQPSEASAAPAPPTVDGLDPWLKRFHELIPQSAAEFGQLNQSGLTEAATAVEQWIFQ